jgi:hypothetical protein
MLNPLQVAMVATASVGRSVSWLATRRAASSLLRVVGSIAAPVTASLLSACASFSPEAPPPPTLTCHSALQCVVKVEVTCAQSPCTISVNHLNVDANNNDVVWEIVAKAGQSYKFKDPGGIFFKTSSGQNAFQCHAEANATRYKCHGNRNGQTYEYGIELVGSPPVNKLDPWVVNH